MLCSLLKALELNNNNEMFLVKDNDKDGERDIVLLKYVYNFASSSPISTNNLLKSKRQLFVTTPHELPIY